MYVILVMLEANHRNSRQYYCVSKLCLLSDRTKTLPMNEVSYLSGGDR
jgi:hypothetical protein